MKKKMFGLIVMLCLVFSMSLCVHADTFSGGDDWKVVFTSGKKMSSNFKTSDMDDKIAGMQPGDTTVFEVAVKNEYSTDTDWYMTNKVLYSLEDRTKDSDAKGAGYSYKLVYTDKNGDDTTLYESNVVGGEETIQNRNGLKEATSSLEDYFYLDTLSSGNSGKITLTVALDGETQANAYQDTMADLQMKFAVELPKTTTKTNTITKHTTTTKNNTTSRSAVRTGDDNMPIVYLIAAAVSGLVLLFLAIWLFKKNKKDKEEAA